LLSKKLDYKICETRKNRLDKLKIQGFNHEKHESTICIVNVVKKPWQSPLGGKAPPPPYSRHFDVTKEPWPVKEDIHEEEDREETEED